MTTPISPSVGEQLARVLDWEEAHVGFARSLAGIPAEQHGARAPGLEHTLWQLLVHLRLALDDLVDFATNPDYVHRLSWPQDYWPTREKPAPGEWEANVAAYRAALARLQALARDEAIDLLAPVPCGKPTQTYLRTLLLTIDHNAYHLGQIVAVRRALGIWP